LEQVVLVQHLAQEQTEAHLFMEWYLQVAVQVAVLVAPMLVQVVVQQRQILHHQLQTLLILEHLVFLKEGLGTLVEGVLVQALLALLVLLVFQQEAEAHLH
jgi:hypothetical protein